MSIRETYKKIKAHLPSEANGPKWRNFIERRDILAVSLIIFVSISSFFLGKMSANILPKTDVTIEALPVPTVKGVSTSNIETRPTGTNSASMETKKEAGAYVGSKNGTKFHLPWCPGAKQISEVNKIWFETKEEAIGAGYSPAGNCKGI